MKYHTKKKPEPLLPVDAFLIFRLQEKIKTLAKFYRAIIDEKHIRKTNSSVASAMVFRSGLEFRMAGTRF